MSERVQIGAKKPEAKRENKVSQIKKTSQSISSPVEQILFLQRTIGNQAVGRLLKSGALQAKLRIGQPGDKYEQEADRVAEQVMRMPDTAVELKSGCPIAKGSSCKEKEEIVQTKGVGGETTQSSPAVESQINSLKNGGQPLPESVSAFFEPRFGTDFSQVRVHSGAAAEQSARDVNANAYTVGHNIVFGDGQFAPGTHEGQRLLAHELTHVVQQSGTNGIRVGQSNEKRVLSPVDTIDNSNKTISSTGSRLLQRKTLTERLADFLSDPRVQAGGGFGARLVSDWLADPRNRQFANDIEASVREAPQHVGEFIVGEVWEAIREHWGRILAVTLGLLAVETIIGILTGVPEPTMLTKVVAVILQVIVVAVLGFFAGAELAGAYEAGRGWFSLARRANGDPNTITEASRSFVRMVWHIVMAVIVLAGVRARIRGATIPRGTATTGSGGSGSGAASGEGGTVTQISSHPGFRPRPTFPAASGQPSASAFGPGSTARQLAPLEEPVPVEPVVLPAPTPAAPAPVPSTTPHLGPGVQPVPAIVAGVSAATLTPVMPAGLSRAQRQLWRTCNGLYKKYSATKAEFASYAARMDPIAERLHSNRASPQDRLDFCSMLNARIALIERLKRERRRYMEMDCDRFDWFARGTTAAERLAQHQLEENNVRASRGNLYELYNRFCRLPP